jgi:MFS family permease
MIVMAHADDVAGVVQDRVEQFLLIMAYAFLVTYQAYYLIGRLDVPETGVPHLIFLGTLVQSLALVVASPLAGRLSDRVGRRKVFVVTAGAVYASAMVVIATAGGLSAYLVGMAIGGLGFGTYMAVDLALVVDVLPDTGSAAKDLGVLNIAAALPFVLAPALAPVVLGLTGNDYAVLYLVAGGCALLGAASILPIQRVR